MRWTVSVQAVVSRENDAMPLESVVSVTFSESLNDRYTASSATGWLSGPSTLSYKHTATTSVILEIPIVSGRIKKVII